MLINKKQLAYYAVFMVPLLLCATSLQAQDNLSFQNRLKSVLGNFNNVRFSSVAYYELNDKQVRSLKEIVKKKLDLEEEDITEEPTANNQSGMDTTRLNTLVAEIKRLIAQGRGRSIVDIRRAFNGDFEDFEHLESYDATDAELRIAYEAARPSQRVKTDIHKMFIITTQVDNMVQEVPDIIALILCTQRTDKSEYEQILIQYYNEVIGNSLANERNIITQPELLNFAITDPQAENLYEKLIVEYRQGNFAPITAEVRGIGTELKFMNTYGKSTSMIANENDIQAADIQKFIRISEGQPFDYLKENEIIVSPDYISWRRYGIETWVDEETGTVYPLNYANANLPSYGVEVKYGLDEINYPSFYSERLMVRAIWDNIKFGLVLPTPGWSSFTKDVFNVDRRLTYAGVGVSTSMDFPIKIIPQSGVFSLSGSYIFGDAEAPSYKDRQQFYDTSGSFSYNSGLFFNDYLIRYTGQMHYTFGLSIDESFLLRFGIGATIYGAETWHDFEEIDSDGNAVIAYRKADDETVGGISMKLEFMSRDITTPYGIALQYFDESLYGSLWVQIPIVVDTFFARLEAKGYAAAFKEILHPWENKSVFMPSVRLVFNF